MGVPTHLPVSIEALAADDQRADTVLTLRARNLEASVPGANSATVSCIGADGITPNVQLHGNAGLIFGNPSCANIRSLTSGNYCELRINPSTKDLEYSRDSGSTWTTVA